jgi:azobenzene reductase
MGPLLVIAGSIREERRSFRVAEYARDRLNELTPNVELLDPKDCPLPLYDGVTQTDQSRRLAERCLSASAFLFVLPEWHAGIPGALKNMLDYLGGAHFYGKPVGIVAVSSGGGGATAISHLRDVVGVLGAVLVGPFVPVRNIKTAFDEQTGRLADERLDALLGNALRQLVSVRASLAARPD